jgi:4-alpha-glucanotransferase
MNLPRASGILLHPTSLPGRFGIGELGSEAYSFVDFLVSTGQHLWQILPLHPTGRGNSPYQSFSVFAGNPLLISLEKLVEDRLLEPADLNNAPLFSDHIVDYSAVRKFKNQVLTKSFEIFKSKAVTNDLKNFEYFCEQNILWLEDYSLFMALMEAHDFATWNTWDEDIRKRQPMSIKHWSKKLNDEIMYHKYQQYQFFKQWTELKKYCNNHGIRLIGDIPIFVDLDSAEVWAHSDMFYLDDSGIPTVVAGVPPDYFCSTGQLWGNPLYRWDMMARDGYIWWIERFRALRSLVDVIRLDHFRGYEKYWEIPYSDIDAVNGRWVPGPGTSLFDEVQKVLGSLPIIAEDLGVITPDVETMREQLGFPGMKVLQFAFGNDPMADDYKPHNYPHNCVVYTGTHDNNTTIGWFRDVDSDTATKSKDEIEKERELALSYLGTSGNSINWGFIRLALASVADTAIIPLQDILGLGSEARMNRPGIKTGNWSWRFTSDMLTDEIKNKLANMTALYQR